MKMLNHNKTNVPEDIDANKTNLLKSVLFGTAGIARQRI